MLIGAVSLFLHLSATDQEFSRHNPGWNGTSTFFSGLDPARTTYLGDYDDLAGQANATLLVVAPWSAPSDDEARRVRDFLAAGNTVVVADDFNQGSDYLAAIGSSLRFGTGNLSSLDRAYELTSAPFGVPAPGAEGMQNITRVIFDRPVEVRGGTPLLETSFLSWIDVDGNARADTGEPLGRYVLAAAEEVGNGRIVAVGDASLFIKSMDRVRGGDNRLFLDRLLQGRSRLVVEQRLSRTASSAGPINTILWVQGRDYMILAIAALALLGVTWRYRRAFCGDRDEWTN